MKYEDLPEDMKPLCWDGKEPITKLSDVEEIHADSASARAVLLKVSNAVCTEDLKGWGFDKDGKPIRLDQ